MNITKPALSHAHPGHRGSGPAAATHWVVQSTPGESQANHQSLFEPQPWGQYGTNYYGW